MSASVPEPAFVGPYYATGGYVHDKRGHIVCGVAGGNDLAERIAADLNLADSIAAEPNIEVTLALHRRDGGETIRASAEFCAACLPDELHAAIAKGQSAASLLGIRTADVLPMRVRA